MYYKDRRKLSIILIFSSDGIGLLKYRKNSIENNNILLQKYNL